ncbi:hypothetical protein CRG98_001228 [Punica granatum]|uniref:Uncharacterized protein n=1 Tax=Punica granatum TaxID=22663 RepID=A0A2I0LCK3_PUNGR|nr:hypothetical protein CRG98_001228 [Punica granatum]
MALEPRGLVIPMLGFVDYSQARLGVSKLGWVSRGLGAMARRERNLIDHATTRPRRASSRSRSPKVEAKVQWHGADDWKRDPNKLAIMRSAGRGRPEVFNRSSTGNSDGDSGERSDGGSGEIRKRAK